MSQPTTQQATNNNDPTLNALDQFWSNHDQKLGIKDFRVQPTNGKPLAPTSVGDLRKLVAKTDFVVFGHEDSDIQIVFEIRAIPVERLIIETQTPLMVRLMADNPAYPEDDDLPITSREKARYDRATPEEQKQYSIDKMDQQDAIIVEGVVSPALTLDPNDENKAYVKSLLTEIRIALFDAIFRFSIPKEAEQMLRNFQTIGEYEGGGGDVLPLVQESENLRKDTVRSDATQPRSQSARRKRNRRRGSKRRIQQGR